MYGLLILNKDYADEFDVCGFMTLDEQTNDIYLKFREEHPEFFEKEFDWYFGSNEVFYEFKYSYITHQNITKEEYDTLRRLFDHKYIFSNFGLFPNIIDQISKYNESNKNASN